MKSALVLSTSLATTLAAGPTAGRQLGTWDHNNGLSGTGTAGGACKFRSTAALFDHTWSTVEEEMNNANGTYPNVGGQLTQGGAYHSNDKDFPLDAWTIESLVLARFDVDLTFNNYAAATDGADANYKYYDFQAGVWETSTDLDATTGTEKMTQICVYKNNAENCAAGDITVEVKDNEVDGEATLDGTPGTKVTLDIGLRKTIGIATTCGQSDNSGDIKGALSDDAKDIFVWGAFDATMSFEFQLVSNKHGLHHFTDASSTAALTAETDAHVSSYVVMSTTQPVTHDLLFIEDPVHQLESNLFSSHPKCEGGTSGSLADGSGNDHCENGVSTYRVDMDATALEESTGGLILETTHASMSCTTALTVTPGVTGHWHCFRQADVNTALNTEGTDIDNTDEPDASAGSTDHSGTSGHVVDGSSSLATLNGAAIAGAGTCSATMTVTCSDPRIQVEGYDTRDCTVVDYGDALDAKAARLADFNSCIGSNWFKTEHKVYTNWAVLEGSYDAAIVQAVRLGQTRSYPYSAASSGAALDVSASFGDQQTSVWECETGTTCEDSDPYKVLSAATMTLTNTLNGLTFPTNGGTHNYATYALADASPVGFSVQCSGGDSSDTSKPCYREEVSDQQCTLSSTSSGSKVALSCDNTAGNFAKPTGGTLSPNAAYGPSWTHTVTLEDPPAGFPEAYVFGVASFSFATSAHTSADQSGSALSVAVAHYEETNSAASQASARRRLGSRPIPERKLVEKTIIVDALQHVISK